MLERIWPLLREAEMTERHAPYVRQAASLGLTTENGIIIYVLALLNSTLHDDGYIHRDMIKDTFSVTIDMSYGS